MEKVEYLDEGESIESKRGKKARVFDKQGGLPRSLSLLWWSLLFRKGKLEALGWVTRQKSVRLGILYRCTLVILFRCYSKNCLPETVLRNSQLKQAQSEIPRTREEKKEAFAVSDGQQDRLRNLR